MAIDDRSLQLDQLMSLAWGKLMMQKRFMGASAVALLGYFLAQEAKDEEFRDVSLSTLFKAMEELKSQQDATPSAEPRPSCSFCGKTEPAIQLAAGPNAFICNECVENLASVFDQKS